METFYRFLGGPRTFWGSGNRTIINNNFIGGMPFSYGFGQSMPMFGGHHCCGGGVPSAFKWMLGFGLASSLVGGIMNTATQANNNNVTSYNPYQAYNPYINPYNNNYNSYNNYSNQDLSSLTAKVNKLEDDLATYKKQVQELLNNDNQVQNNNVKEEEENSTNEEIIKTQTETEQTTQTEQPKQKEEIKSKENTPASTTEEVNNTEGTPKTQKTEEVVDNTPQKEQKTLDDVLNELGFNNLDDAAKNYVKSRISQAYIDDNGNIKYDIKAVVHDGDNINTIINRFYTNEEQENLEIAKAKLHTQGSETKLIANPLSGDTITAKGVSEYGIKALMQDAQKGITRQGEITKTNKRISDLKTAFINGQKKLSKAYVLQNKLMTESEYNKIIQEKYS